MERSLMNCDWTSKISSLIDGELSQGESERLQAHLRGCSSCQSAREDFLLLRQQFGSYQWQPSPLAQQEALRTILFTGGSASATSTPDSAKEGAISTWARLRAPFAGLFGAQRPAAAMMGAMALVLLALGIGLFAYLRPHGGPADERLAGSKDKRENRTAQAEGHGPDTAANLQTSPEPSASVTEGDGLRPGLAAQAVERGNGSGGAANNRTSIQAARASRAGVFKGPRDGMGRRGMMEMDSGRGLHQERGRAPEPDFAGSEPASGDERRLAALGKLDLESPGDPEVRTARYVEQAQVLLRSFRNARLSESGPASDLAYEKQRSQKLLYQNIVLRREAASRGNVPVEKLLSSLEPILIDIANLPDNPAQDDVRPIRERMQRKNIVALLQVNSTPASRSN